MRPLALLLCLTLAACGMCGPSCNPNDPAYKEVATPFKGVPTNNQTTLVCNKSGDTTTCNSQ